MTSKASNVKEYLASLPEDRRKAISTVRDVILKNLPKGYEEGMQYGMIGYFVPHSLFPDGYHCDPRQPLNYCALGSQKNYMSLYLMCVYGDSDTRKWFEEAYAKAGKKLDMGKSCVRFKSADELPLDVVGKAIARVPVKNYVEFYVKTRDQMKSRQKKKK